MIIGYTTGVYDLFHIGHLNLLRNAKTMCDKLIVGVSTDELVFSSKQKKAVIPFAERMQIVQSIRFVDAVIPKESNEKIETWKKLRFDILFIGDDWFQTDRWKEYEAQLTQVGVRFVYFPYTKGTSSTLINKVLEELRNSS